MLIVSDYFVQVVSEKHQGISHLVLGEVNIYGGGRGLYPKDYIDKVHMCLKHTSYLSRAPRAVPVEKNLSCGENFKFLYMTDVEKSEISPHVK